MNIVTELSMARLSLLHTDAAQVGEFATESIRVVLRRGPVYLLVVDTDGTSRAIA